MLDLEKRLLAHAKFTWAIARTLAKSDAVDVSFRVETQNNDSLNLPDVYFSFHTWWLCLSGSRRAMVPFGERAVLGSVEGVLVSSYLRRAQGDP